MNNINAHKPGYKHTPLGWIPEEWKVKEFGEVFDYLSTNSYSREFLTDETASLIQNIHYGDIHSKYNSEHLDFNFENVPYVKEDINIGENVTFLKDGDLIIADASEDYEGVGKSIELKNTGSRKVLAGLHTIAVRDKSNNTINGFRTYLLHNKIVSKELKRIATGTSVYSISKGNISKIKLPLPTHSEQSKIAAILTSCDSNIQATQQLIDQLKERNKWLMQQLLTGKKRLKGFAYNSKFRKTDFGLRIPEDWKIVCVNDIFEERNEKSSDQELYPLFSLTIENGLTEKTDRYERSFLLKDQENNQYKIVHPSDILFNPMNLRFGAIAQSKVKIKVSVSAYYNVITKCNKSVDVNYYEMLFLSDVYSGFYERIAIGSLIEKKRVHLSNFLKLQVPLPSLEEQDKIAKVLNEAENEIRLLEQQFIILQQQKKGLMQKLLSGEVRVKM